MAGGLSYFYQRGEALPKASSLPAVIISYHQAGVNLVCHSFFYMRQHYLYREEEIKAKPPSIAKWLAAHTLIRGETPQQKRHPFLLLLYHIIRRVSTWFVTRFLYAANTICTGKGLTSYPLTYPHSAALSPRRLRSTRARLPCRAPPVYAVRPAPQTCAPGGETR